MRLQLQPGDLTCRAAEISNAAKSGYLQLDLEPGRYTLGRGSDSGLARHAGLYFEGVERVDISAYGAVIEQAVDDGADFFAIHVKDSGQVRVRGLEGDGQHRGSNEQTHFLQLSDVEDVDVVDLTARNMKGDGVKLVSYNGRGRRLCLDRIRCFDNGRSGVTIHSGYEDVFLSKFFGKGNKDQSIDFEPPAGHLPRAVTLRDVVIEHESSQIGLTLSSAVDGIVLDNVVIKNGLLHAVNVRDIRARGLCVYGGVRAKGPMGSLFGKELKSGRFTDCHFEAARGSNGESTAAGLKIEWHLQDDKSVEDLHFDRTNFIGHHGLLMSTGVKQLHLTGCRSIAHNAHQGYGYAIHSQASTYTDMLRMDACRATSFEAGLSVSNAEGLVTALRTPDCVQSTVLRANTDNLDFDL